MMSHDEVRQQLEENGFQLVPASRYVENLSGCLVIPASEPIRLVPICYPDCE